MAKGKAGTNSSTSFAGHFASLASIAAARETDLP
jgi:hypothetical protein